jgi:WW domain-containing oxidoreductase
MAGTKCINEMLNVLETDQQEQLTASDIELLTSKIKEYENLPTSITSKLITWGSNTVQIILVVFLLLFSGIPSKLGLFRAIAERVPQTVGLTPAFSVGVEDGYSFLQLDDLDLSGQTALVTGGNSGVGYETAKYLVKLGAEVTILCRNEERCTAAAKSIGGSTISTLIADLSDLKNTQIATTKYAKSITKLDMLFLNAGIYSNGKNDDGSLVLSIDGIEKVFATNHVGHHLMWKLLESKMKKAKVGRIVLTSSGSNFDSFDYGVATDLDTLNGSPYSSNLYGQSKLAQVMWAQELTRQLGSESNIFVNSFHPGMAATEIWEKNPDIPSFLRPVLNFLKKNMMWSSLDSALTMLYLGAAADELQSNNVRGKYFHPHVQEVSPNVLAESVELQKRVWLFSDELVKRAHAQ